MQSLSVGRWSLGRRVARGHQLYLRTRSARRVSRKEPRGESSVRDLLKQSQDDNRGRGVVSASDGDRRWGGSREMSGYLAAREEPRR